MSTGNALPQYELGQLWLNFNQVGDSGAQALAKVLPQCGLEYLDLGSNQIGDSGAQALAMCCPVWIGEAVSLLQPNR